MDRDEVSAATHDEGDYRNIFELIAEAKTVEGASETIQAMNAVTASATAIGLTAFPSTRADLASLADSFHDGLLRHITLALASFVRAAPADYANCKLPSPLGNISALISVTTELVRGQKPFLKIHIGLNPNQPEQQWPALRLSALTYAPFDLVEKIVPSRLFFSPMRGRILVFPLTPTHGASITHMLQFALLAQAEPYFIASKTDPLLVLVGNNNDFIPAAYANNMKFTVPRDPIPSHDFYPCYPDNLEAHCYCLYADLLFKGRDLALLPSNTIIKGLKLALEPLKLPLPIYAQPINSSVLRLYCASHTDMIALTTCTTGNSKKVPGTFNNRGLVFLLHNQEVLLLAILCSVSCLAPLCVRLIVPPRLGSDSAPDTLSSAKRKWPTRFHRRIRIQPATVVNALALIRTWLNRTHSHLTLLKWLIYLYKLSFTLALYICYSMQYTPTALKRMSASTQTYCKVALLFLLGILRLVYSVAGVNLTHLVTQHLVTLQQPVCGLLAMTVIARTVRHPRIAMLLILLLCLLPSVHAMEQSNISETDNNTIKSWVLIALNVGAGLKDKMGHIVTYIRSRRTDFAIVSETGLTRRDITSKEYYSKGFDKDYVAYHVAPEKYRRARPDDEKERRGISVIVHRRWLNYINEKDIEYNRDLNLIRIPIVRGNSKTQIIGVYAEPEETLREIYWSNFEKWFKKREREHERLIIIGDFNAPLNPRLDKSNPNEHREETYTGLSNIIENERLLDAWRLKHGRKRDYTWTMNSADPNAPATRIDHALISPALQTKLHTCDILPSCKPLTTDHAPLLIEIERPSNLQDVSNVDNAPEVPLETIDVQKLKEGDNLLKYQRLFTEEAMTGIRSKPKATQYEMLREAILENGISIVKKKKRTLNAKPKPVHRTLHERLASYCHTVLLSKHHIRKSVAKKIEFPITKTLNKLLRFLPSEYTLANPVGIITLDATEEWLQELSKLSHKLNTDMLTNWKDKKVERILDNCERTTSRETSDTRGFFAKASGLIYKTIRNAQQLVIDLEIPPTEPGKPLRVDDPKSVMKETSRFWEIVFRKRNTEGISHNTPWFSEKFKARHTNLHGAEKLLEPITIDELNKALKKLKNKKAAGPDDVAAELLKSLPEIAVKMLLDILEDIRRDPMLIPEDWKLAKIFLLHKSGNANLCSNYRPISITSVIYKVYMNIQTERLTKYVEDNKLISEVQGGFRRKRSTMDKVAQLTSIFAARLRKGQENHTIFVDFKKAYDSVPHEQLLDTLLRHGIPPQFVEGIRALYTGTKASVITVYGIDDPFQITRGVKQGCPMSPILFNLFLEPLLEWLQDEASIDNHVLAFADDVALNAPTETDLQQSMNRIQVFCHYHAMEIGIAKNKTAYMTSSARDCNVYYRPLEESWDESGKITLRPATTLTKLAKLTGNETYKYLGVYVNPRLDWTEHYDRTEARLRQHLHFLYNSCYTHRQIIRIINVLIVPYVTYGMEVITPNPARLNRLDRMLERLVNMKGGVIFNAKREYNYLSVDMLGQGQISIREKVIKLQHQGRLKHGLNSPDKLTEKAVRTEWNAPTSWYSKDRFECNNPSKFKIVSQTYPIEKSLECLFEDNDATLALLRDVYRINNTDTLITPEGNLIDNVAQNEAIRKHLCTGSSTRIKPILLFRVRPTLAIQGILHDNPDPKEQVTIFTDGSEQGKNVGYAVYLAEGHKLNHAEGEKSGTKNFKAELHAAISALLLHDPFRPLRLIIDNKSVCNVLDAPLHATTNHPDEVEWLTAAHEVLALRRELGIETKVIHVYSHLDERNNNDRMQSKLRKMKERFGDELPYIIAGNEAADQLAKRAAHLSPTPVRQFNSYMAPYQLKKADSNHLVFNVSESLSKEHQENYHAILSNQKDRNKQPRYDYLSRKGIDWHRSAYLGKNTNRAANPIQKHAHKSRRKMFADKETRFARRNSKHFTEKRYHNIVVQNPHCDLCRDLEQQPVPETRTHYLHCKGLALKRTMIKMQVLSTINQRLRQPIRDIPCYWNEDEKNAHHPDELWRSIEAYTPEDAARALIPRAWVTYLKKLSWKDKEDLEPTIATCQYLMVEGLHECWKTRCINFYRTHRPAPPPASPT